MKLSAFWMGVVQAAVVGRKKEKTLRRVGIFAGGPSLAASHFKGGTAAKSSRFEEVIQGWPLRECSAFSVPGLVKIPNALAFFSFFLDQLWSFHNEL
ncbi:hypothetical protein T458_13130 [Brevibacillus panacihumi W25]|uniref:Uncharacterized protein n=1 Tax=Brevibacillus panacihumi W25 TaxID=1408254 RepID=V6M7Q8_9BACL|nr:hypothetical protein [Brevibacillus panacihumi]EST54591.1 hypothetical protein T458_13130 [Brevibacillus panacihumi W25]